MPANRSRTAQWRRCLDQLVERNGTIEIAIVREERADEIAWDLIWRVRVVSADEQTIIVEQPQALGRQIELEKGVALVAVIAIGQNRWMFKTLVTKRGQHELNKYQAVDALHLVMPETVERCQRRSFYRVETAAIHLPQVDIWPLLDGKSVVLAERANELRIQAEAGGTGNVVDPEVLQSAIDDEIMPEVGPAFSGSLLNIGGGGIGLQVEPDSVQELNRHKLFWIRFSLPPELKTPICATTKLAHTHLQSNQSTYAGLAFDFSFNPAHQKFVIDQICRYIAVQQRNQLQRRAAG